MSVFFKAVTVMVAIISSTIAFARVEPGADADTIELTKLAQEAGRAYAARDLVALERITGDDYVQIDVRGGVLNRVQWLDFVKNRNSDIEVESDDISVRYYGEVALVTGHWTYKKKRTASTER